MKTAIEKAIELAESQSEEVKKIRTIPDYNVLYYLHSPLFWQALGKAMGRGESYQDVIGDENTSSVLLADALKARKQKAGYYPMWIYYWHRFIDSLASGQSPDDFFKELLNQN